MSPIVPDFATFYVVKKTCTTDRCRKSPKYEVRVMPVELHSSYWKIVKQDLSRKEAFSLIKQLEKTDVSPIS